MQERREDWIRLQRSAADNKREMATPHFMSADPAGAINLKHTSMVTQSARIIARARLSPAAATTVGCKRAPGGAEK
jgi:hypothetical protein